MFFGRVFHSDGAAMLNAPAVSTNELINLKITNNQQELYQKNRELNFTFNLKWYVCVPT